MTVSWYTSLILLTAIQLILETTTSLQAQTTQAPTPSANAFFNGFNSYAVLPNTLQITSTLTSFSFRTCNGGQLLRQEGSNGDYVELSLIASGGVLRFSFRKAGGRGEDFVDLGSRLNTNQMWHTVDLEYLVGNLTLSVDGERITVASQTVRSYVLDIDLSGSAGVEVGRGLIGCVHAGPGVQLTTTTSQSNVQWGSCPLENNEGCAFSTGTFGNEGLSSFANFVVPRSGSDPFKVSMFFRTRKLDGLLMFTGEPGVAPGAPPEDANYVAVQLVNGAIRVDVKEEGETANQPKSYTLGGRLADGEFKFVDVSIDGENMYINVNDQVSNTITLDNAPNLPGGVLYIAGMDFQNPENLGLSTTEPFKGCIRDLRYNEIRLDFYPLVIPGFQLDSPSLESTGLSNVNGSCVSDDTCASSPCTNGGVCTVTWNDFECDCPIGFTGKICSDTDFCVSNPCPSNSTCNNLDDGFECLASATFDRDMLEYSTSPSFTTIDNTLQVSFRTRDTDALLLRASGGSTTVKLEIVSGNARFTYNSAPSAEANFDSVSDGEWHTVEVTFLGTIAQLTVDNGAENATANMGQAAPNFDDFAGQDTIQVGSQGGQGYFKGCMKNLRVGGVLLPFFESSQIPTNASKKFNLKSASSITVGCTSDDVCGPQPCVNGVTCTDIFNDYNCTCVPGYSDKNCNTNIDDCISYPCQNGATCIDLIARYTCSCTSGWEGVNCEQEVNESSSVPLEPSSGSTPIIITTTVKMNQPEASSTTTVIIVSVLGGLLVIFIAAAILFLFRRGLLQRKFKGFTTEQREDDVELSQQIQNTNGGYQDLQQTQQNQAVDVNHDYQGLQPPDAVGYQSLQPQRPHQTQAVGVNGDYQGIQPFDADGYQSLQLPHQNPAVGVNNDYQSLQPLSVDGYQSLHLSHQNQAVGVNHDLQGLQQPCADGYQSLQLQRPHQNQTVGVDHDYQGLQQPGAHGYQSLQLPHQNQGNLDTAENEYEDVGSSYEFPRNLVALKDCLQEGDFGALYKAEAWGIAGREGASVVAVKMMTPKSASAAATTFFEEFRVLKMLDNHPNIVRLLGCCTKEAPFYLILEYMSGGSLQSALRTSRSQQSYENLHGNSKSLLSHDLVKFALDVAKGMSFLSRKKIIHRDLATRNVLVSGEKTCKLSNFGFSREGHEYERTSKTRLPIRWMAPESLFQGMYTTGSDVWSFGVLLWEIVTLGGTPYSDMIKREVMEHVKQGHRLEKPQHCEDSIFNLMMKCWNEDPQLRPSFAQLELALETLLQVEHDCIILNGFNGSDYNNPEESMEELY
ncbi:uncharacterized protein LOC144859301 isoform X1 [Branchiostoma floridae x Branchiostoma japonicum]